MTGLEIFLIGFIIGVYLEILGEVKGA